ncbi:hypothetical protein R50072_26500 [Simiduia litorea]
MVMMAQAEDVTLDAEGKPCEEMVDLSETGQFHRLHFECAEKKAVSQPTVPGPESVLVPVQTPQPKPAPLPQQAPVPATQVLTVRAPVELAKADSLTRAQHQLFQQMVQSCTHGWHKVGESVVQDNQQAHYQLTIQYQCLGR